MEIPVYLFTGFLEGGKTSFIVETMKDPNFNDGKRKYLIITCEEGEVEYYPDDLGDNVSFASFEDGNGGMNLRDEYASMVKLTFLDFASLHDADWMQLSVLCHSSAQVRQSSSRLPPCMSFSVKAKNCSGKREKEAISRSIPFTPCRTQA